MYLPVDGLAVDTTVAVPSGSVTLSEMLPAFECDRGVLGVVEPAALEVFDFRGVGELPVVFVVRLAGVERAENAELLFERRIDDRVRDHGIVQRPARDDVVQLQQRREIKGDVLVDLGDAGRLQQLGV